MYIRFDAFLYEPSVVYMYFSSPKNFAVVNMYLLNDNLSLILMHHFSTVLTINSDSSMNCTQYSSLFRRMKMSSGDSAPSKIVVYLNYAVTEFDLSNITMTKKIYLDYGACKIPLR